MSTNMAEQGMLLNVLSAKQGTRSIRASSSSARNSLTKENIPIKSILLEFSSVIQENLKRDSPTLTIRFRENGDNVECILGGTTQEVGNAKSNLLSMERDLKEKKLLFATNTCSDLKRFSIDIEHIVSNVLKNGNQHCVAKQVNNEVFLYGFDRNVIDKAATYLSRNISHKDFMLCGSLREKKAAVTDHFKKGYQDRIVVYIDETCRLNLLGQKNAVDEACSEYVEISEGRKSISPTNMLPQGKTKVTQKFGPLEPFLFRFFSKSVQLEQVVNLEKVGVERAESDCSFFIKGEEENVLRAIGYLNEISPSICTNKLKISSSGPISIIRSPEDKGEFEKHLQKFNVLLEKKITYVCGRLQVTNRLHDNYSSMWLSLSGKTLTVKFSAFDDLCVDKKFVMNKRDPSKGVKFKGINDVLVEIAVPDKVSRGQTDDNTIGEIINTTLGKVASSSAKVVAFLISPFANWDFKSIMRIMVNSFVEWLMTSGTAEGFSVILGVEKHADFVETDEYFGSRLWIKMKGNYIYI
ncbi:uncharacterized protein LOC132724604 [Ruditapes philippinarum]|uniref:uncharacterized protein LOC132724604 n=1 Tax=Ruditapes philippinarum TaxID=129788 RepID=UPI00295B5D5F|nr:uncharacterized protein LOC132724604 [Ruditapes philippinarum]